jgi:hypothetical protein
MIVILQAGSDAIIAPLTTSVNYIPDSHTGKRCVIDEPSRLHCYCIPDALVVGKKGFAFTKFTYIQVQGNLVTRPIIDLQTKYAARNLVSLVDELTDEEYSNLLYCIYKSQFVPRGIRKMIEPVIEQIEKARVP